MHYSLNNWCIYIIILRATMFKKDTNRQWLVAICYIMYGHFLSVVYRSPY